MIQLERSFELINMESNILQGPLLVEGKNCWRKNKSRRVSFLTDGASYFGALARAVNNARKTIYIACWDIDSRVPLLRDDGSEAERTRLGLFLNEAVAANPDLQVHILAWDFSVIFLLEREFLPVLNLGWRAHQRIQFRLDGNHSVGASHHQKMVVIDDSIAFVGGMDVSRSRWDTPEHALHDPRRTDPDGTSYPPFHDVQVLVDYEAAHSLGDLFRARWATATGELLASEQPRTDYPWPGDTPPDINDVEVAISRTASAYADMPEVREIEALYRDAIASANKHIYIENQYLTSWIVAEALIEKLQEPAGPEIVVVVPQRSSGWLEKKIMDSLRARIVEHLRENDRYGRFGIYYPVVQGMENGGTFIHSKIVVIDDSLVRVGSSNLTNRSMRLDTECDVAVEANGRSRIRHSISRFRNKLLAEHLGVPLEAVEERLRRSKSLLATVEQLRYSDRTLKPLPAAAPEWLESLGPTLTVVDPDEPIIAEWMVERFVPEVSTTSGIGVFLKTAALILLLAGAAIAWQWGPLAERVNVQTLAAWGDGLQGNPITPLAIPLAYTIGGLVLFPVTLMIGATAAIFDPLPSVVYSLLGCLTSAVVFYAIGLKLGRVSLKRIPGTWLNNVTKHLSERGLLTVIALRAVPVAPFPIVCLIMGASGVSFKHYVLGTLIGMTPGILAISVFAGSLIDALKNPGVTSFAICIGIAALMTIVLFRIKRLLTQRMAHYTGQLGRENRKANT